MTQSRNNHAESQSTNPGIGVTVLKTFTKLLPALLVTHSLVAQAEVVSVSDTHFVLRHEASSTLSPEAVWQRLIKPASWWHPDHTYSGDAANLTLDAQAGGLWREDWEGNSVLHGKVVLARPNSVLRMEAPFGPLQDVGAYVIWTITIKAAENGSHITFDERAMGVAAANLKELAPAVDGVKAEALSRLSAD